MSVGVLLVGVLPLTVRLKGRFLFYLGAKTRTLIWRCLVTEPWY